MDNETTFTLPDFSDIAAGGSSPGANDSGGTFSGIFQQALSLGAAYASRRLDVDLAERIAGMQPNVVRPAQQTDLTTRTVSTIGGIRMGDMLPFIALGLVAYLVLR